MPRPPWRKSTKRRRQGTDWTDCPWLYCDTGNALCGGTCERTAAFFFLCRDQHTVVPAGAETVIGCERVTTRGRGVLDATIAPCRPDHRPTPNPPASPPSYETIGKSTEQLHPDDTSLDRMHAEVWKQTRSGPYKLLQRSRQGWECRMIRKQCFAPVVNLHTRILILGSLPGEKSLAQEQYYANKQNAFWFLISHIVGTDLVELCYEERLAALREHGIGLWDVVADARRSGSLDSSIRDHQANDLVQLIQTLPNLSVVAFNGRTAAKLGMKQLMSSDIPFRIVELPSSSPAFTLPVGKKLDAWMVLRSQTASGPSN